MKTIDIGLQKSSVEDLLALAIQESGLILAQSGHPVAEILPLPGKPKQRVAPLHPGAWEVSGDFDQPLPDGFWLGTA